MKISDELLQRSAPIAREIWMEDIPDILPEHKFSRRFNKKMRKLVRQQKHSKAWNQFVLTAKRVAIFAVIICTVTFSCLMSVEACREIFIQVITELFDDFTQFRFSSEVKSDYVTGQINFTYIPEEMQLDRILADIDPSFAVEYASPSGDYFMLHQSLVNTDANVTVILDTENAVITNIEINGDEALLVEKNGEITLQWATNYFVFILESSLTRDVTIRIAEGIVNNTDS